MYSIVSTMSIPGSGTYLVDRFPKQCSRPGLDGPRWTSIDRWITSMRPRRVSSSDAIRRWAAIGESGTSIDLSNSEVGARGVRPTVCGWPRSIRSTLAVGPFSDFVYPGCERPSGVIERGVADDIVAVIDERAASVASGLRTRLMDCLYAGKAWQDTLQRRGVSTLLVGGSGQHIETVPRTSRNRLSGYRTDDDGVVTHWWLAIGLDRLIFDPTAYQFEGRGGVSLSRYLLDGIPLVEWRGKCSAFKC